MQTQSHSDLFELEVVQVWSVKFETWLDILHLIWKPARACSIPIISMKFN